jgi:hypothetical protein
MPPLVEGVTRPSVDVILEMRSQGKIPTELQAFLSRGAQQPSGLQRVERCLVGRRARRSPRSGPELRADHSRQDVRRVPADTDRRIAAGGRPPLSKNFRTWSGDARAHWEGDTLVVETRNFNRRTRSFSGAGLATEKVVTERFTRRSATLLDYEATIIDPKTFTDKVVIAFPMALRDSRIYENACHEHNYSLANSLSALRKAERDATAAKAIN